MARAAGWMMCSAAQRALEGSAASLAEYGALTWSMAFAPDGLLVLVQDLRCHWLDALTALVPEVMIPLALGQNRATLQAAKSLMSKATAPLLPSAADAERQDDSACG